jgi:flagellar motor switch protein FliG
VLDKENVPINGMESTKRLLELESDERPQVFQELPLQTQTAVINAFKDLFGIEEGGALVVEMINMSSIYGVKTLLDYMWENLDEYFESILKRMFVFEDYVLVSNEKRQALFSQSDPHDFALALMYVDTEIRKSFSKGLPEDYLACVKEETQKLQVAKPDESECFDAQWRIRKLAVKLGI